MLRATRRTAAQRVEARDSADPEDSSLVQEAAPKEYGRAAQTFMKHICRVTFNRATVAFFGAAPLRLRSLCYYDVAAHPGVKGHVALTLDDAPCRGEPAASEMRNVLDVLDRYDAKATFMTVGAFAIGHEDDLVQVLKNGHELGNHGMHDRRYDQDSPENFGGAVDACTEKIMALQRAAGVPEEVKWFRAPHGKYTKAMESTLEARSLTNVMCDTYASCPIIQDGVFIGEFLSKSAKDGSIILLHMPERSFRTWCSVGLTELLEGLKARGLKVVTLGELAELAKTNSSL